MAVIWEQRGREQRRRANGNLVQVKGLHMTEEGVGEVCVN